jgi:molybdopterin converting factor small subunit
MSEQNCPACHGQGCGFCTEVEPMSEADLAREILLHELEKKLSDKRSADALDAAKWRKAMEGGAGEIEKLARDYARAYFAWCQAETGTKLEKECEIAAGVALSALTDVIRAIDHARREAEVVLNDTVLFIMATLLPLISDAVIVGKTYGVPQVISVVREAEAQLAAEKQAHAETAEIAKMNLTSLEMERKCHNEALRQLGEMQADRDTLQRRVDEIAVIAERCDLQTIKGICAAALQKGAAE